MGRLFLDRTTCKKCEERLDGISRVYCKKCASKNTMLSFIRNPEKHRKYDRLYQQRKRQILVGYKAEEYRKYREKYPEKVNAQQALNRAVKGNKIQRSACEICGETKVHGHHSDYSKPFDVKWLCPIHHKQTHLSTNF